MPFGKYQDFDDCVSKNSDKEDPKAYCAVIKRNIEGKSFWGSIKSAMKAIEDILTPNPQPAPTSEPALARTSSFTLTKDVRTGDLRWFGFVSGNFKDRDHEVFPADVHQEFVNYMDETKAYPELWVWHTPGTRFGKADWAEFEHGFLLMSGLVDKGKEAVAEAVAAMPDQGMSHGFKFQYREPRVIGHYRTYEVSVLPLAHAAFPWTKIEILKKETSVMKPEKRAYLESVLGKDRVDQLVSQADALQKALVSAGVDWKEFDPPAPDPSPAPAPAPSSADLLKAVKESEEFKALASIPAKLDQMAKAQNDVTAIFDASIKALQEQAKVLQTEIKKSQDDLVAAALRPRATASVVTPPSKSKENVIPESDPLAARKPSLPIDAKLAGSVAAVFGNSAPAPAAPAPTK